MPKDPKRNVSNYQIRGGYINEYEYNEEHGEITEEEHERPGRPQGELPPDGSRAPEPQATAERVAKVTAAAHKKVERGKAKSSGAVAKSKGGNSGAGPATGAKKSGAKTAAKKQGV